MILWQNISNKVNILLVVVWEVIKAEMAKWTDQKLSLSQWWLGALMGLIPNREDPPPQITTQTKTLSNIVYTNSRQSAIKARSLFKSKLCKISKQRERVELTHIPETVWQLSMAHITRTKQSRTTLTIIRIPMEPWTLLIWTTKLITWEELRVVDSHQW